MIENISEKQFQQSTLSLRTLNSIYGKTINEYNKNEMLYLESEIKKHETIINLYNEQKETQMGKKPFCVLQIPVTLTMDNYRELHFNYSINGISKFRLSGLNDFVYSNEIIHKVDIDYPLGFFFAGEKIVDAVILSKTVTVGEFDNIVKRIYDEGKIDINSKTEIFKMAVDYITEMFNRIH